MVDPKFVTIYNRSQESLEEFALFSICVAGKNAHNTANSIEKLLKILRGKYLGYVKLPLDLILSYVEDNGLSKLQKLFKEVGIGNHTGTDKIPGRAKVCFDLADEVINNNLC